MKSKKEKTITLQKKATAAVETAATALNRLVQPVVICSSIHPKTELQGGEMVAHLCSIVAVFSSMFDIGLFNRKPRNPQNTQTNTKCGTGEENHREPSNELSFNFCQRSLSSRRHDVENATFCDDVIC